MIKQTFNKHFSQYGQNLSEGGQKERKRERERLIFRREKKGKVRRRKRKMQKRERKREKEESGVAIGGAIEYLNLQTKTVKHQIEQR